MKETSLEEIAAWTGGSLNAPGGLTVTRAVIDSRKAGKGSLFFCLRGENTDGHLFAADARRAGAVVVGEDPECDITVVSSLRALAAAAAGYRSGISARIAAVTGSCGKTTVTRMAEHILKDSFETAASPGNYNNLIGLSLSVLGISENASAAVLEMGANHTGEIAELCGIARPSAGVLTCVGDAHIGYFGSRENIIKAKFELADSLAHGGVFIYNHDQAEVKNKALGYSGLELFSFGLSEGASFRAGNVESDASGSVFELRGTTFRIGVPGIHNVYNALAACSLAYVFGVGIPDVSRRLEGFALPEHRMQRLQIGGITLIDDSYNSSPSSVRNLFSELLKMYPQKDIIAVIGQMNELGDYSEELHSETGKFLAGLGNVKHIFARGEYSGSLLGGAAAAGFPAERVYTFSDARRAAGEIRSLAGSDSIVVLKGSRLEKLEEIIGYLE